MMIGWSIFLHNLAYRTLNTLVVIDNVEVHPKHDILQYRNFFLDHIGADDRVIDIGCGKGETAFFVSEKAVQVVGMDIKEKNIASAKEKYTRQNLSFIVGDVLAYPFSDSFDAIILSNVLEHIEYRVEFLKKLHDISDIILLRVPLITRDWLAVYKKVHGFEYRLDPTHYIEYTEQELLQEIEDGGWRVEEYSVQFGEWWGVIKITIEPT